MNTTLEVIESTASKAETEFRAAIEAKRAEATTMDRDAANKITKATKIGEHVHITPTMAAIIFLEKNTVNRSVSIAKVRSFTEAMKRGEWRYHHQGIAFYPDGSMADGQHRMAAVALSDSVQEFTTFPSFQKEAIDTIDRSKKRSAGEGLEMLGVANGKVKATIGQTAMEYLAKRDRRAGGYSDIQIEQWCLKHDDHLSRAVEIGHRSDHNVTDPSLTKTQASSVSILMLLGGWHPQQVVSFIASIQQGVSPYPESPTVDLSKQFMRAKLSDAKKDKLGKWEVLALSLKGAILWAENKSVRSVRWNPNKEEWPSISPPVGAEMDEAA